MISLTEDEWSPLLLRRNKCLTVHFIKKSEYLTFCALLTRFRTTHAANSFVAMFEEVNIVLATIGEDSDFDY